MGRRQPRTGRKPPPLPVRDGLNPSRVRLPAEGRWPTVAAHLLERFAADAPAVTRKLVQGEIVTADGEVVTAQTPYQPDGFVYLYRDPAPEPAIPFEVEILHADDELVVVDKPHFLATTPRGEHITETVLVRLRKQLALPTLSPIHRLDRATAGVVVFSVNPAHRGAYQTLFARREVRKVYRAVAGYDPGLTFPLTRISALIKERGTPQAREVDGEPNSRTDIELLEVRGDRALYELYPATGKTHQLRVHLAALGIPIVGDHFYPVLREVDRTDFTDPLQLLARSLEFTDPITGQPRRFTSRRRLSGWEPS